MIASLLRRIAILFSAVVLLAPVPAAAAGLDWLHGSWSGAGIFMGQHTSLKLDVAPSLRGSFTEIHIVVAGPADPFEGVAVYQTKAGTNLSGVWFDSQGSMLPTVGTVSARQLVSHWKSDGGAEGRSSYSLLDDGSVEVIDSIKRPDGSWQDFGRHKLQKQ